jgi:hypothetical protein
LCFSQTQTLGFAFSRCQDASSSQFGTEPRAQPYAWFRLHFIAVNMLPRMHSNSDVSQTCLPEGLEITGPRKGGLRRATTEAP